MMTNASQQTATSTPEPTPLSTDSGRPELRSAERYYQLAAPPFGPAWDPTLFYRSSSHDAALNEMLAAVRRRDGLIVLTGDAGTGKTTLCHALRKALGHDALAIVTPDQSLPREDFLKTLLVDFGVVPADDLENGSLHGASELELSARLYEFVHFPRTRQACVLVVDDVQQAQLASVFESICTLSDFESEEMLLQVVLVGQASLRTQLTPDLLTPLGQRVPVWCGLKPLTAGEVGAYVRHRLAAVGAVSERIQFSSDALEFIARESAGIPRAVNEMCNRAIERGHLARAARIDQKMMAGAIVKSDVDEPQTPSTGRVAETVGTANRTAGRGNVAADVSGLELDLDLDQLPATGHVGSGGADSSAADAAGDESEPAGRVTRPSSTANRTALWGKRVAADVSGLEVDFDVDQLPAAVVSGGADSSAADAAGEESEPAGRMTRPSSMLRRGRWKALSVAAIALGAVVATLGLRTWGGVQTPQTPDAARPPAARSTVTAPAVPAAAAPAAQSTVTAPAVPAAAGPAAQPRASAAASPAPSALPLAATAPPKAPAAPAPATPPLAATAAPKGPAIPSAPPVTAASRAPDASARRSEPGGTYLIEVATFRRPEGAASLLQELKALGLTVYDREVDLGARGLMRQVIVGPYDMATAQSALARVQKMPDYGDARMRRLPQRSAQ